MYGFQTAIEKKGKEGDMFCLLLSMKLNLTFIYHKKHVGIMNILLAGNLDHQSQNERPQNRLCFHPECMSINVQKDK